MENVIQQSTDYEEFSLLEGNRGVSRGHAETLKRAFEETGNLLAAQPILVNKSKQIIDGQHRFEACKELGLPIYFTVISNLNVNDARNINIIKREWLPLDYAKSYAVSGNKNYQRYLQLGEDYGVAHSVLVILATNADPSKKTNGVYKDFRTGDLKLKAEDMPKIINKLDKLVEYKEYVPHALSKITALAFLKAMDADSYSHARMLRKLEMMGGQLEHFSVVTDAVKALEEIYNYRAQNTVRLY
jgi:hypothetical protein